MGVLKVFAKGLEIRTSGVFVRNGPILLRFAAQWVHARRVGWEQMPQDGEKRWMSH